MEVSNLTLATTESVGSSSSNPIFIPHFQANRACHTQPHSHTQTARTATHRHALLAAAHALTLRRTQPHADTHCPQQPTHPRADTHTATRRHALLATAHAPTRRRTLCFSEWPWRTLLQVLPTLVAITNQKINTDAHASTGTAACITNLHPKTEKPSRTSSRKWKTLRNSTACKQLKTLQLVARFPPLLLCHLQKNHTNAHASRGKVACTAHTRSNTEKPPRKTLSGNWKTPRKSNACQRLKTLQPTSSEPPILPRCAVAWSRP